MKKEMAQWQNSPEAIQFDSSGQPTGAHSRTTSLDYIPKLDESTKASGVQLPDGTDMKARNATTGSLPLESS